MSQMTEEEIDERWPVLAQVVRAVEWHGGPDLDYFCRSFTIERDHHAERADAAERELAALRGKDIVEILVLDPGLIDDRAPNACAFLTGYFA